MSSLKKQPTRILKICTSKSSGHLESSRDNSSKFNGYDYQTNPSIFSSILKSLYYHYWAVQQFLRHSWEHPQNSESLIFVTMQWRKSSTTHYYEICIFTFYKPYYHFISDVDPIHSEKRIFSPSFFEDSILFFNIDWPPILSNFNKSVFALTNSLFSYMYFKLASNRIRLRSITCSNMIDSLVFQRNCFSRALSDAADPS